jgi:hypothetical protein
MHSSRRLIKRPLGISEGSPRGDLSVCAVCCGPFGRDWHLTSFVAFPTFGRYRRHSDHFSMLALSASVAFDPERTLSVRRSIRFGHPICDAFFHMIDVDQFFAFGMT